MTDVANLIRRIAWLALLGLAVLCAGYLVDAAKRGVATR